MNYLFLCTPTSGTASMLRILRIISGREMVHRFAKDPASDAPGEGVTFLDPGGPSTLTWFRGPRNWRPDLDLSAFRIIAHFRDPRDLACNQYWWELQHPNTHDAPEVAEARRRAVEEGGIDAYVERRSNAESFNQFMALSDGRRGDAVRWTSYTQLCCAFDYMIDGLCQTFNRAPREVADALRKERPENLGGNPNWVKVGGTWKGADITPGRFRQDLRPETARSVTKRHAKELAFCRRRDAPFLAHHYER